MQHVVRHELGRVPAGYTVASIEPDGVPAEPPSVWHTAADQTQWTQLHIVVNCNVAATVTLKVY